MLSTVTYKSNWWGFIGKRVLIAVVAFFVVTMSMIGALRPKVCDYVIFMVNPNTPREVQLEYIDYLEHKFGIDGPFLVYYGRWLGSFFSGEWGNSIMKRVPVKDLVF